MKVRVASTKFNDHFSEKTKEDVYVEVDQDPLILFDTIQFEGTVDSLTSVDSDGIPTSYFFIYDEEGNQHNIKSLDCKTVEELLFKASVLGCTIDS